MSEPKTKTEEKKELNTHQQLGIDVYKQIIQVFPKTNLDRISVLVDLLKIEMRSLSFVNLPKEKVEELGPNIIKQIQEALEGIWKEDQKHRDKRKEKNESSN